MIYINNFQISDSFDLINVSVQTNPGYVIESATFWTDATFKNSATAIDLTFKLNGSSNTEFFNISTANVEVEDFKNGIFFIEFTSSYNKTSSSGCSDCNNPLGVAASFHKFKECLLGKVLALDVCSNCNDGCNCVSKCEILNLDNHIDSIGLAIEFGLYTEAIALYNTTTKLTSSCTGCIDLSSTTTNSGLNYSTLNNNLTLQ